jgi:hypothetical protein
MTSQDVATQIEMILLLPQRSRWPRQTGFYYCWYFLMPVLLFCIQRFYFSFSMTFLMTNKLEHDPQLLLIIPSEKFVFSLLKMLYRKHINT